MINCEIGNIYTFKLNSGEELLGKVTHQQDGWLELESPFSIAPGAQGLGMILSLFTAGRGQKIQVNIQNIAMFALTDADVRTKYLEATTGIKVPEKKLILG